MVGGDQEATRSVRGGRRDGIVIAVLGVAVVALPRTVYPWVLPGDRLVVPWGGWVWVSAVSLAPFAVVAALRVGLVITRWAGYVAYVPCAVLVGLGEGIGLSKGAAPLGGVFLIVLPIFAFIAIGAVLCIDLAARGAIRVFGPKAPKLGAL